MKPESRPNNILISPKYYEAWNRPDSDISLNASYEDRIRPDNILISPNTMKPGLDQIMVGHREAWITTR